MQTQYRPFQRLRFRVLGNDTVSSQLLVAGARLYCDRAAPFRSYFRNLFTVNFLFGPYHIIWSYPNINIVHINGISLFLIAQRTFIWLSRKINKFIYHWVSIRGTCVIIEIIITALSKLNSKQFESGCQST